MWEVFREHREFRRLFLARYASLLGDWFNLLAVLALLRALGEQDARTVGTLIILKLIPTALVGPVAGVVADRFSRKKIMVVADVLRFGLVLSMFAAPFVGEWAVALLYTTTFLQIAAQAFAEPARLASFPNVVPPRLLGAANALSAVTWSITFTLGAGLGGVVTSLLGWKAALALDAGSYLVSLAIIVRLQLPPLPTREKRSDLLTLTGLRDVLEALSYLRRAPQVAALLTAKLGWGLAGGITLVLTLFGERVYPVAGRPDLGIALFYVARGVGTAIGPILARRVTREEDDKMRLAIGASFVLAAACYGLFALVDVVTLAVTLVVVAHLGGSTIWVFSTVLLQRTVPDGLRGRIFATELGLCTGAISVVTWFYGRAIDAGWLELRPATLLIAGSILAAATLWTTGQVLTRRRVVSPDARLAE
jgi:MFS family permease